MTDTVRQRIEEYPLEIYGGATERETPQADKTENDNANDDDTKRANSMRLRDRTCDEFSSMLASKMPTPGGGGAAALTASLAASLASMTCRLMSGKRRYADIEHDIERYCTECDEIRKMMLVCIDDDATAYERIASAYKIDRNDPNRKMEIERTSLAACLPPIRVIRGMTILVPILEWLSKHAGMLIISDVGCAASLCISAMETSRMNVYINMRNVTTLDTAPLTGMADVAVTECATRCNLIVERVENTLLTGK